MSQQRRKQWEKKVAKSLDPNAKEFLPSSSSLDSSNASKTVEPMAHEICKEISKDSTDYGQFCIICSEKRSYFAVGACNHPVCSICSLRMRFKSNDTSCSICKQALDFVIVFNIQYGQKLFDSFGIDDVDSRMPGMEVDHSTNMVYHQAKDHYKELLAMRSFKCPINTCNYIVKSSNTLIKHFEKEHHSMRLCMLCLEHRPIFIQEQEIFPSENQLKKHYKNWGLDGKGHPLCEFCNKSYFDSNHLYRHMNETHMTCHMCPTSMSQRYYKDSVSLNIHISNSHIICKHCERNGDLAAFTSHGAFCAHMSEVHHEYVNPTAIFFGQHGTSDSRRGGSNTRDYVDFTLTRSTSTNSGPAITPTAVATAISNPYLNIPTNMKISGRVTGTGNFYCDENEESLQAFIDESSATNSYKSKTSKKTSLPTRNMEELFPPLQASAEPSSLSSMKSTSSLHPMSIVPTIQQSEAKKRQEMELQQRRLQELESRRSKREESLAEAFGVSSASSLPQLITDLGLSTSYAAAASTQHYIHILHTPLYPSTLVTWAAGNQKEVISVEKRINEMLASKTSPSVHLKPMASSVRLCVHAMARYYDLNSYEYEMGKGKYVSLVKCPNSSAPIIPLSTACSMRDLPMVLAATITSPPYVFITCSSVDLYAYINNKKIVLTVEFMMRNLAESIKKYRSINEDSSFEFKVSEIYHFGPSTIRLLFPSHEVALDAVRALVHPASPYSKDGLSSYFSLKHPYQDILLDEQQQQQGGNIKSSPSNTSLKRESSENDHVIDTDSWTIDDDVTIIHPDLIMTASKQPHDSSEDRKLSHEIIATSDDDWELLDIKEDSIKLQVDVNTKPSPSENKGSEMASQGLYVPPPNRPNYDSSQQNLKNTKAGKVSVSPWAKKLTVDSVSTSQSRSNPVNAATKPTSIRNQFSALDIDDEEDEVSVNSQMREPTNKKMSSPIMPTPSNDDIEVECPACAHINIVTFQQLSAGAFCSSCAMDLIQ